MFYMCKVGSQIFHIPNISLIIKYDIVKPIDFGFYGVYKELYFNSNPAFPPLSSIT